MKRIIIVAIACMVFGTAAIAQQPNDQMVFLSKALVALQAQRNAAADEAANARARADILQDQVKALQAELEKMKAPKTDAKEPQ